LELSRLKVLNLEDTPDDSWLLKRHLAHAGYDCVIRREQTVAEFEKALREDTWDIILADYFLPGFTALDALRIARQCEPDVPFIVVSGAVGEQAAVEVLREGAADYVMKDSLARLAPAIKREMQESEERRRRRAAEAALRESEMRLRGILDHSPNVVFMKDTAGRYVLANHCYENLLGLHQSEIRGKTDAEIFRPECASLYAENEAQVLQSGIPMQFEEMVPVAEGTHTRLANRFPLFDELGRQKASAPYAPTSPNASSRRTPCAAARNSQPPAASPHPSHTKSTTPSKASSISSTSSRASPN
jgi:two-component system sensor histidine kinase UhpB